jgi:hypothetical protein
LFAVAHDASCQHGTDAGERVQLLGRREIDVDARRW